MNGLGLGGCFQYERSDARTNYRGSGDRGDKGYILSLRLIRRCL